MEKYYLLPCTFHHSKEAEDNIKKGNALPLAGGKISFSNCKIISNHSVNNSIVIDATKPETWNNSNINKNSVAILINKLSRKPNNFMGLNKDNFHIIGVVNISPDSFSPVNKKIVVKEAIEKSIQLYQDGASIIDIGGESTRPGAIQIDSEEEQRRIIPVIKELSKQKILVSCDTRNTSTMVKAIDAGARIINDISALSDKNSAQVIRENGVGVILMHMKGNPSNMQDNPKYENVLYEILTFLETRKNYANSEGIPNEKILVDPGIGFGKTDEHNIKIFKNLSMLHNLQCNIAIGASRKSLIGRITKTPNQEERLPGSLSLALVAMMQGVQFFRVHDVKETIQALNIWKKLYNE